MPVEGIFSTLGTGNTLHVLPIFHERIVFFRCQQTFSEHFFVIRDVFAFIHVVRNKIFVTALRTGSIFVHIRG